MSLVFGNHKKIKALSFNITPVIDIIFLLIVFFVLDFQFFGHDSTDVNLPDKCDFAQSQQQLPPGAASVTVTQTPNGTIKYLVNNYEINPSNRLALVQKITTAIDSQFQGISENDRIVILRIDKNLELSRAKYAIAAVSASTASKIKIATLAKDVID